MGALGALLGCVCVARSELIITEFLAVNVGGLKDEDGASSDWLEIYNAGSQAVDLAGWHLTDDPNDLGKWTFPQTNLASGGYLVVFASDKDRRLASSELHTNFKLTSDGEYLGLVQSNGVTIEWEYAPAFPAQSQNVSYGVNPTSLLEEYYTTPTPGAPNGAGLMDVLEPVTFSHERGFYDAPFQVSLSCASPGVTIRYTLDGSPPTATSGTVYSGPIPINTTAVLRVLAYRSGYLSQPVVTHTYIFPSDVVNQTSNPPGYPTQWASGVSAWYGMYPGYPDSEATLRESLLALPTVCISGRIDDIFGASAGYYNHGNKGRNAAWQKAGSIEFIRPDGDEGFQVNAGVQGRAVSVSQARKRGFKIEFKSLYGPSKLRFPGLFDDAKEGRDTSADEFDALILRPGRAENYTGVGYNPVLNIYFRDIMLRDVEVAVTGHGSRNLFVQLYLNGLYWGVYNLTEVYDSDYYADYFGGPEEDWFEVRTKDSSQRDGKDGLYDHTDLVGMNRYLSFLHFMDTADLSLPANYQRAIRDIDPLHFAEYIIYYSYYGVGDWPDNNWIFAMRNGAEPLPGRFFSWDAEKTWFENDDPQSYKHAWYSPYLQSENNPEGPNYHPVINRIWEALIQNEEFRMLFADRSYELMHHGGLLTDENRIERFMYYVDLLNLPIRIDQRRWSADDRRNKQRGVLFTYADIQKEVDRVLGNTEDNVSKYIAAFRAKGLYPSVDPPRLSLTGGNGVDSVVSITGTSGDAVYYTTDGSDPRMEGGGIAPGAETFPAGGEQTLIGFGSGDWRYYVTSTGLGGSEIVEGHPAYGADNWKHPDFNDTPTAGTAYNQWHSGTAPLGYGTIGTSGDALPLATPLGYGGNPSAKYPTTYFRRAFEVAGAAQYIGLRLEMILEDGGIVYLNGRELVRSTGFNQGNVGYTTYSQRSQSRAAERAVETFQLTLAPGDVREGRNVIAVEVHNDDAGSSDLAMELGLTGIKSSPTVDAILTATGVVKARSWQNGEWSALNQLAVSHPAAREIIISEIMYNPPMRDGVDGDGFEFLELKNVSAIPINLRGMTFTRGIDFTFDSDHVLAPGAFAVLVSDEVNFNSKYPGVSVAGSYSGSLLANDGETLELRDVAGELVVRVQYNDKSPWPEAADNGGYSLVPIHNDFVFDADEPTLWRASTAPGGSPGTDDPLPLLPEIVINEILAHTDPPQLDSVELFNPNPYPVEIAGWSLTDDEDAPGKFVVPSGTPALEAYGIRLFTEADFNPEPGNPTSFALSSQGESLGLFAPDASQGGWRLIHQVDYGASANGASFGLHALTTGGWRHPVEAGLSLGQANLGPSVGPVIINEIMYDAPLLGGTEYIELLNISDQRIALHDPSNPANTWRINGAGFDFPTNVTLDAGAYLLVVDSSPEHFRSFYTIPPQVQVFGPLGRLNRGGETLALQAPDSPELDPDSGLETIPYITVDQVSYRSEPPWTADAAGTGLSLGRIDPNAFGDDPINWAATQPSPGRGNLTDDDLDGIPDAVEASMGLDPANPADAQLDSDLDGATNIEEFLCGTDYRDPADVLDLRISRDPNGGATLRFESRPGRRYLVQARDPAADEWITIANFKPLRGGSFEVPLVSVPGTRLYRLMAVPPLRL